MPVYPLVKDYRIGFYIFSGERPEWKRVSHKVLSLRPWRPSVLWRPLQEVDNVYRFRLPSQIEPGKYDVAIILFEVTPNGLKPHQAIDGTGQEVFWTHIGSIEIGRCQNFIDFFCGTKINRMEKILEILGEEPIEIKEVTINGENRRVMFQHPNSKLTFRTEVPDRAKLRFGIAIDPTCWGNGDGATFKVDLKDEEQIHHLFDRHLDPHHTTRDMKWFDEEIDLSAYSGKMVEISFITTAGPKDNRDCDWAVWSEPAIIGTRFIKG